MLIADFFELSAERESVVTIGVFDGVHLGHRRVLGDVLAQARLLGFSSIAVTLHPRPRELFRPDIPSLYVSTLDERLGMISEIGLDQIGVLRFDRRVASIEAREFVEDLRSRLKMRELWVGADFALGRGRKGTIPVLRQMGAELGFEVNVVEPYLVGGERVSSTLVQQRILEGDVAGAADLLGRFPSVAGPVVVGAMRGRTIDLPTANVATAPQQALPANGIYAVRCYLRTSPDGADPHCDSDAGAWRAPTERLLGVASIGTRPTFDDGERTLEVHILDFSRDIYGACLRVEFLGRLRPELRFPSVAALLAEVQRDIATARGLFAQLESPST